jgi:hypothetical protein
MSSDVGVLQTPNQGFFYQQTWPDSTHLMPTFFIVRERSSDVIISTYLCIQTVDSAYQVLHFLFRILFRVKQCVQLNLYQCHWYGVRSRPTRSLKYRIWDSLWFTLPPLRNVASLKSLFWIELAIWSRARSDGEDHFVRFRLMRATFSCRK